MTLKPTAESGARQRLLTAAATELHENGEASISLRAVARRAGLSHAAPAHFFGNRAGLLTAMATDGFERLAQRLDDALAAGGEPLEAAGRAYIDFGAAHPALIDLMFRGRELVPNDDALMGAKAAAIGRLQRVVATRSDAPGPWTLISWALVHGLVVLGREGVLAPLAGRAPGQDAEVSRALVELYSAHLPVGERASSGWNGTDDERRRPPRVRRSE